jgi:endonuclease III
MEIRAKKLRAEAVVSDRGCISDRSWTKRRWRMSGRIRDEQTGSIWNASPRVRAQAVRRVCEAFERTYGRSRLGNPEDPLDDLVYIVLSNKTSPEMARQVYARLKREFPTWDEALVAPEAELRHILKPAGLSTVKSQQIRGALRKIEADFGSCDLSLLGKRSETEVQSYLVSLPGVSEKVAKCVMMYTMDVNVLPVDSHVHRIAKRLGWTARKRADQCHDELEALVPLKRRYTFHVGCIMHGRAICRPRNPSCERCCISAYCDYFENMEKDDR